MAKSPRSDSRSPASDERLCKPRAAGDLVGKIGGVAFKRFGFVQSAVVERWPEIVGDRYAKVSVPESIRFPAGSKSSGTLNVLVEGAHAPLLQHMAPMIVERVNRFFGYPAVARLAWRQGRIDRRDPKVQRPAPAPVPQELGEGLRHIADPELRACLESLASTLAASEGPPVIRRDAPLHEPPSSSGA